MNFPELEQLSKIGKQVRGNATEAEAIVMREMGVTGSLHRSLAGT